MAKLNSNNFLIWEGEFSDAPFTVQANGDSVNMTLGAESVTLSPLTNDVATFGISYTTFEFVTQDNDVLPATFNSVSGVVTYYPPDDAVVGARNLTYRWRDTAGNSSNIGTITINIQARATSWRKLATSGFCVLVAGENNGQLGWATLEEYYTDDDSPVMPASTRPNVIADPFYVAPENNTAACPVGTLDATITFLLNFTAPGDVDPNFRLASFEVRDDVTNALMANGSLNLAANGFASVGVPSGTVKLILALNDGESDGVPKIIHLITDSGTYPDQTYTTTGTKTFAGVVIGSSATVTIKES